MSDWPPHTIQSDAHGGLQTKRLTEALAKAGYTATLDWYDSWLSAYNRTEAALADASGFWMCNKERAKTLYFSDPIFVIQHVMFYLKGNNYRWRSLSDLKGRGPFGVTTAYYYGDKFSEAVKKYNFQIREVRLESLVFNLLIHGRVNYVPMDILNGLELIERYVPKESQIYITFNSPPFDENYLHLVISKKHPNAKAIVTGLNHAISLLNDKYSKQLPEKKFRYSCPSVVQNLSYTSNISGF
nr:transporter substrate-binding domain-containing protein [Spartinivicinus marinus]